MFLSKMQETEEQKDERYRTEGKVLRVDRVDDNDEEEVDDDEDDELDAKQNIDLIKGCQREVPRIADDSSIDDVPFCDTARTRQTGGTFRAAPRHLKRLSIEQM